jgi:cardiolipin synthase
MVYVLVDWLGTGKSIVALLQAAFEPSGVYFVAFNPWFQRGIARTHRKIVVIDQRLVFLGGLNINDDLISDDDSGTRLPAPRWDFAVSIIGPLVDDVHVEVAAQWRRQSAQTLRRRLGRIRQWYASRIRLQWQVAEAALVVRDNLRNRAAIERQLLQALGRAHHSAVLVTPYFAPGRKLRRAMLHAAMRGVDITLLIGVGQFVMQDAVAQSFYPRFIHAGIRRVEYRATQLHAKAAVVDDAFHVGGIFTDGDLRRLIEQGKDFSRTTIGELMHKHPRRVHPEQLAVEAVDLMESHRINQVLVADTDGRLVGALHIHDLTRAKVI